MLLSNRPGYVFSGVAHAALLVATLLSFAQTRKFDDAQEAVAVETLSDQQFNQIMKGDKSAKEVKPLPRADKVADITETKPLPPVGEAKRDVPTPPPPLKHQADPGEGETPEVPTPPRRVAEVPPPKPDPVKPPPTPEKPAEEAEIPKPVPRPEPPKEQAKEQPKKEEPQFRPDQLAKLLEKEKEKDLQKPVPKPKSGEEAEDAHKFNVADINRLLSKEAAQRKASTGAQLQQVASLGAANASAAKMSPSMQEGLDDALRDQFKQCWTYIGLAGQSKYVPVVQVEYAQDGTLIGQPVLLNPPSDPALRGLADSAMRAARRCNPLHIPAIYQPYYEYWKGRNVRFDPDELS